VKKWEKRLKVSYQLPITQLQGNTVARGAARRIDLNLSAMPELGRSSDAVGGTKSADVTRAAAPNADDVAHLSSGSDAVAKLKVHLDTVPEIRQQRVEALKQAIRDGTYKISPPSVATAMLADARLQLG
jgi:flagellar biosynthesis anti-sigma factor FlgM